MSAAPGRAARRLAPAIACLGLLAGPCPAAARAFSLDDLLRNQAIVAAELAPGGRFLVVQTTAPYERAPTFDFDGDPEPVLGQLSVVDLGAPARVRRLGAPGAAMGLTPGPISPSGRSMVVYKLQHRGWNTGVVDLTSGRARWLGFGAQQALWGRSVQWRSDHELVAIALPRGELPLRLRAGWQAKARLVRLWRAAATGRRASASVVGSGAFAGVDPRPQPSQLISVDLRTGAHHRLALGVFFDIELSPDARYLAAVSDEQVLQPGAGSALRGGDATWARRLNLIDLATGKATIPLGQLDLISHLLSWSPVGNRLLVFARANGQTWSQGQLISLNAKTQVAAVLASARIAPQLDYTGDGIAVVRAAWLGEAPLIYGRIIAPNAKPDAGSGARSDWIWLGPKGAVNLTEALAQGPSSPVAVRDQALVLVAGGAAWRVSPGAKPVRLTPALGLHAIASPVFGQGDRFAINPDLRGGKALAVGARAWALIGADSQAQTGRLDLGDEPIAMSIRGLITEGLDADGVAHLDLRPAQGAPIRLIAVNRRLAGVTPARIREVNHLGPSGEVLKSWLYLPPQNLSARSPRAAPWPLIVLPYPGAVFDAPPSLDGPGRPGAAPDPEILAARGYAVLLPSLPRNRAGGEPARALGDQIGAVVDASLAAGDIDGGRIVLWGHSFGGYAALEAAAQSQRYRAIIAASAPSDLASVWGAAPAHNRLVPEDGYPTNAMMGWVESGQANLGGPPWSDPARYVRNSPLFAAGAITTPIFLICGDQDFVPAAESEAMFAALYRQNKDAVLMRLWGEGHTPSSPANIRALYSAVFSWLDQVLVSPAAQGPR